ncbi:MAG: hypothetical protein ACYDDF_04800 [Thermoplasmatota archaeon]
MAWIVMVGLACSFVANAGSVTITSTSYAKRAGFYDTGYFEDANAPVTGCTSPCLTVDSQANTIPASSGSFSLAPSSNAYFWTPAYGSATAVPTGALSLQVFADPAAPALDGSATGALLTGSSFTITLSTTQANDVVVVAAVAHAATGAALPVSSISDGSSLSWHSRTTFSECTSGTEGTTESEWYAIATPSLSNDIITVSFGSAPAAAAGLAFGVAGADTTTPFDSGAGLAATAVSGCAITPTSAPSVSAVTTSHDPEFVFALTGAFSSTTQTAGSIGGTSATLIKNAGGTGDSGAAEYLGTSSPLSSGSCSFGTATTYWGAICDAIDPPPVPVTVTYLATNSAGTQQGSAMVNAAPATVLLTSYQPFTFASASGSIPAAGYAEVILATPSTHGLTIHWGNGKPTEFQVETTYRT